MIANLASLNRRNAKTAGMTKIVPYEAQKNSTKPLFTHKHESLVSGEAPTVPVVSAKSGSLFEKRLIEAYIEEHGTDPVSGEDLTSADLVEVKSSKIVRPRPPTLTSIPALLTSFQDEWDSIMLETHKLRSQLVQVRQELTTALYQNDAATRVIARVTKERDEAREALAQLSVVTGSGSSRGPDEMEVDKDGLPSYVKDRVDETMKQLSSSRRKRSIPKDWTDVEGVSTFQTLRVLETPFSGASSVDLDAAGELTLVGGANGSSGIYSLAREDMATILKASDGAIVDVAWAGRNAITASAGGVLRIWDQQGSDSTTIKAHSGGLKALATHPRDDLLASVGEDKSWVVYDLEASKPVIQAYGEDAISTADFHPDGHLFATGTGNSALIYDIRTTVIGADFKLGGTASSMSFSENGFWLAVSLNGETDVQIWDLRKMAQTKALDIGNRVDTVKWDYTGQYLATGGQAGISVQAYSKSTKSWSEPLRTAVSAVSTAWGNNAASLVAVDSQGVLNWLGIKDE
ncbi:Prp19-domain-containing protein [Choiromyces venosus 120613-1]|uniref:Pre-mRNA-processing factor 19 n=1 Tax=Choiromyces venosus 120613-1 TaxID=1336337 RepID=A0A3N4JIN4_9PEZI|nr:Prp19-domain-containing protein [Choiromyces venosus 120613-1]